MFGSKKKCDKDGDWPETDAGEEKELSCEAGYTGNKTRKCDKDGKWETVKDDKCVKESTSSTENKKKCTSDGDWVETDAGKEQKVSCGAGFTGNKTRKCDNDGNWESVADGCERITCTSGGGWGVHTKNYGDSLTSDCSILSNDRGQTGVKKAVCNAQGKWDISGECRPSTCQYNGETLKYLDLRSEDCNGNGKRNVGCVGQNDLDRGECVSIVQATQDLTDKTQDLADKTQDLADKTQDLAEKNALIQYQKIEKQDIVGYDIKHEEGKSIQELAYLCHNTDNCKSFNSSGWIKHNADKSKLQTSDLDIYIRTCLTPYKTIDETYTENCNDDEIGEKIYKCKRQSNATRWEETTNTCRPIPWKKIYFNKRNLYLDSGQFGRHTKGAHAGIDNDYQKWYFDENTGKIKNKQSGLCLDHYDNKVQLLDCQDNNPNQSWTYENQRFENKNKCLNIIDDNNIGSCWYDDSWNSDMYQSLRYE